MHEILVNRLGGLSLPRKSVVRITDRPDMTFDVYLGRKTTIQQQQYNNVYFLHLFSQALFLENVIKQSVSGNVICDKAVWFSQKVA